jgi:hypothetical protein
MELHNFICIWFECGVYNSTKFIVFFSMEVFYKSFMLGSIEGGYFMSLERWAVSAQRSPLMSIDEVCIFYPNLDL